MKKTALFNYTTGEIYTYSGEYATQVLYKKALSMRREARRYGYVQDFMCLAKVDDDGSVIFFIEEWLGGNDTPTEDINFSMVARNRLRRCKTAKEIALYMTRPNFDAFVPMRVQYEIAKAMMPYAPTVATKCIRKLNLKRYGRG